jgi:subtilisin family serine protease
MSTHKTMAGRRGDADLSKHGEERRRGRRRWLTVAAIALALACDASGAHAQVTTNSKLRRTVNPIPGQYVVVLDETASVIPGAMAIGTSAAYVKQASRLVGRRYRGKVRHVFSSSMTGFSVIKMTPEKAALMSEDPAVRYVVEDGKVSLPQERDAAQDRAKTPWGLDRIDQRILPLDGRFTPASAGAGVNVYLLDTGIYLQHKEFEGRATIAFDATRGNGRDCSGHGTHVAGIVGGASFGVAKAARLHAVRVLDCYGEGSYSNVIAGVEWVTKNALKPAVANMSLSAPSYPALDDAVRRSIANGIVYVVSAGNNSEDIALTTPARVEEAITVAATDDTDRSAWYTNYGSGVDLYAPGTSIPSAWIGGLNATELQSGTSMAAPHVAGVAALILQEYPGLDPADVAWRIRETASPNVVQAPRGDTPNRLLFATIEAPVTTTTSTSTTSSTSSSTSTPPPTLPLRYRTCPDGADGGAYGTLYRCWETRGGESRLGYFSKDTPDAFTEAVGWFPIISTAARPPQVHSQDDSYFDFVGGPYVRVPGYGDLSYGQQQWQNPVYGPLVRWGQYVKGGLFFPDGGWRAGKGPGPTFPPLPYHY